jgi:hypothetical protein
LLGESVPSCRFPLLFSSLEQTIIDKTNQHVGTFLERFFYFFKISKLFSHYIYTGCPRRNVQYFGRVFLMLNYTDITQNTYIQS